MISAEWDRIPENEKNVIEHHQSGYPVKVGTIAKKLGISVKIASMAANISGQIRLEDGQYVIRVNRYESRERQRFTIAHELSHFLLHRNLIDVSEGGITDNVLYRSGQPNQVEYEANRLAADIIMPISKIEESLAAFNQEITEPLIETMAELFQVSNAAMAIRLQNLKN